MSMRYLGERLLPEGEDSVSPEFQRLWDELGSATDAHYDTSASEHSSVADRGIAARRYLDACQAILRFVHKLEESALNDPSKYPGT